MSGGENSRQRRLQTGDESRGIVGSTSLAPLMRVEQTPATTFMSKESKSRGLKTGSNDWDMKFFRKLFKLPSMPNHITSSWTVGRSVFFYHSLDWVYLKEWWDKQPLILYMN